MTKRSLWSVLAVGTTVALAGTVFAQNTGTPAHQLANNQPANNHPAGKHDDHNHGQPDKKEEKKGEMKPAAQVGQPAPQFSLKDTDGKEVALSAFKGKVVVLEWFNPQCPYVQKHHQNNHTMKETYASFKGKDVVWIAVNSGAPGSEGSGAAASAKAKKDWGIEYPILIDESGKVGRMYGAKTTPHMYVIDKTGKLVYAGAIDDDNSAKDLGKTNYVKQALTQVLGNETVSPSDTKPYGCSVKYGKN